MWLVDLSLALLPQGVSVAVGLVLSSVAPDWLQDLSLDLLLPGG